MSEHHSAPKAHEPHAPNKDKASAGPHDPKEINPKMSSDIAHWPKELGVSGDGLHEAIRAHGRRFPSARSSVGAFLLFRLGFLKEKSKAY